MSEEEIKDVENNLPDDDVVEFVFNNDGEEDLKATLKKFRKDLKEEKVKSVEYLTLLQRERADFLNYKKDEFERFTKSRTSAVERIVEDLLPVLDAYDMAFSNREAWEKVEVNWRTGVEYIHQQLLKVLADNGVMPIEVKVGDVFDSNIHEPVENLDTSDVSKDHTVARVTQSGYKMGERILRPARIKVYILKK